MRKLISASSVVLLSLGALIPTAAHADTSDAIQMSESTSVQLSDLFSYSDIDAAINIDSSLNVDYSIFFIDPDTSDQTAVYSSDKYVDGDYGSDYVGSTTLSWNTQCNIDGPNCFSAFNNSYATSGHYVLSATLTNSGSTTTSTNFNITLLPVNLMSLSTDNDTVLPFHDNNRDSISGSLQIYSPQGEHLDPYGARVSAILNHKSVAQASLSTTGRFSLTVPAEAIGTILIDTNLLHHRTGGEVSKLIGSQPRVTSKMTGIRGVVLTTPERVYPSHDGYKDSATIGIRTITSTGHSVPATGVMTITQGSHVIMRKTLSGTSGKSFTWNGRTNGSIVNGTYKVSVAITGPQGGTKTAHHNIKVSDQRLVTITSSHTYGAYDAIDSDQGDSFEPIDPYGAYGARMYSSGFGDTMVVALSVPKATTTSRWRISFNNYDANATFVYYPCGSSNCLSTYKTSGATVFGEGTSGTKWTKWSQAGAGSGMAYFMVGSTEWGSLYVDSFTIEYSATVLR